MALSLAQLRVDKWSKCVLLGSTLLLVYSIMVLVSLKHHRRGGPRGFGHGHDDDDDNHRPRWGGRSERDDDDDDSRTNNHHRGRWAHQQLPAQDEPQPQQQQLQNDHDGHHRRHGPPGLRCRVKHFAHLGVVTGITGIISAFRTQRCWALVFMVLVLVTEISALGVIGYGNAQAVRKCQELATVHKVEVQVTAIKFTDGSELRSEVALNAGDSVNVPLLAQCTEGVRHAAVIGSLIVGVVACALACCTSRFSHALLERDVEDAAAAGAATSTVAAIASPVMAIVISTAESSSSKKEDPAEIIEMAASPSAPTVDDEKRPLV